METIQPVLAILFGLLIRLAVPIIITAVAVTILRAEDKRWEAEAKQIPLPVLKADKPYCWVINNCPPEKMKECKLLYANEPCWQANRQANGYMNEACLTCKVFRQASAPAQHVATKPVHS
jgi:hypothetical protein